MIVMMTKKGGNIWQKYTQTPTFLPHSFPFSRRHFNNVFMNFYYDKRGAPHKYCLTMTFV